MSHQHNPFVKRVLALFKKTHEDDDSPKYPSELNHKYIIHEKTLGVGSFAVVKECSERSTGEKCAVKIILKKVIAGKFVIRIIGFKKLTLCLIVNRKGTHVGQ